MSVSLKKIWQIKFFLKCCLPVTAIWRENVVWSINTITGRHFGHSNKNPPEMPLAKQKGNALQFFSYATSLSTLFLVPERCTEGTKNFTTTSNSSLNPSGTLQPNLRCVRWGQEAFPVSHAHLHRKLGCKIPSVPPFLQTKLNPTLGINNQRKKRKNPTTTTTTPQ